MSFSWIAFTLLAAFSQSWRNAFQSKLAGTMSVAGVTLARFIWAGPIALIYLCALYQWKPVSTPDFRVSLFSTLLQQPLCRSSRQG